MTCYPRSVLISAPLYEQNDKTLHVSLAKIGPLTTACVCDASRHMGLADYLHAPYCRTKKAKDPVHFPYSDDRECDQIFAA